MTTSKVTLVIELIDGDSIVLPLAVSDTVEECLMPLPKFPECIGEMETFRLQQERVRNALKHRHQAAKGIADRLTHELLRGLAKRDAANGFDANSWKNLYRKL